jgi:hypothetical protein
VPSGEAAREASMAAENPMSADAVAAQSIDERTAIVRKDMGQLHGAWYCDTPAAPDRWV